MIYFLQDGLVDFLSVQGTFKRLLQHHSSKASILWHSAFFTVQLSHPYLTTGKTITLTRPAQFQALEVKQCTLEVFIQEGVRKKNTMIFNLIFQSSNKLMYKQNEYKSSTFGWRGPDIKFKHNDIKVVVKPLNKYSVKELKRSIFFFMTYCL